MTIQETPNWDDLEKVDDPSTDDKELPTIKLDPGKRLMGDLVAIEEDVGQFDNTLLTIASEGKSDRTEPSTAASISSTRYSAISIRVNWYPSNDRPSGVSKRLPSKMKHMT